MFDLSAITLFSFITTCIIIELTPGPNMAYLAILSASAGRKSGFAATAGIALGLLLIGLAAALGVATLITGSSLAYQVLRWGGVAYLLWLAYDGWRSENETSPTKTQNPSDIVKFFRRGLITNLLNPKAAVFYVAILPTFIDIAGDTKSQGMALTIIYVCIATTVHSLIVLIAGTAREFLENPRRRHRARRILSILLAGIALWFAFSTGQSIPPLSN